MVVSEQRPWADFLLCGCPGRMSSGYNFPIKVMSFMAEGEEFEYPRCCLGISVFPAPYPRVATTDGG